MLKALQPLLIFSLLTFFMMHNIRSLVGANNAVNEMGAQWLSGRVLVSRSIGYWFEPHRRHCIVSLSKTH